MITSVIVPPVRTHRRALRAYPCPHLSTYLTATGSIRYVAGEIVDTTEDRIVCADCGRTLPTDRKPRARVH